MVIGETIGWKALTAELPKTPSPRVGIQTHSNDAMTVTKGAATRLQRCLSLVGWKLDRCAVGNQCGEGGFCSYFCSNCLSRPNKKNHDHP